MKKKYYSLLSKSVVSTSYVLPELQSLHFLLFKAGCSVNADCSNTCSLLWKKWTIYINYKSLQSYTAVYLLMLATKSCFKYLKHNVHIIVKLIPMWINTTNSLKTVPWAYLLCSIHLWGTHFWEILSFSAISGIYFMIMTNNCCAAYLFSKKNVVFYDNKCFICSVEKTCSMCLHLVNLANSLSLVWKMVNKDVAVKMKITQVEWILL